MSYRTPGVYIEEISTLPPSVAQGATAVPAFIGCTERGPSDPTPISTLLDYQSIFGGPDPTGFQVDLSGSSPVVTSSNAGSSPDFLLYYAISHFFKNGGGRCYVASTGGYGAPPDKEQLLDGLALVEKEDEPTLIVIPDAVRLSEGDYNEVGQSVLAQCEKLGDRFGILDVRDGDVDAFRNGIGMASLKYGAAYHPYLSTTLNAVYDESGVSVTLSESSWTTTLGENGNVVEFSGDAAGGDPAVQVTQGSAGSLDFEVDGRRLNIRNVEGETGETVAAAFDAWAAGNDAGGFDVSAAGSGEDQPDTTGSSTLELTPVTDGAGATLASLGDGENANTAVYNQVKALLADQKVTLPPSGAMAGIYARVDNQRGVWKAPANVSVSAVAGPTAKITHADQEDLNVDPNSGKSINAIRHFSGKGTLVWGARTLAGNDNEWRYVPVRRLFSVIEEATKKASAFAVFEPNDATTWLKVKGMIDAYLYGLWEQGALQGSTPDAAFFVNVGLGKTMTAQDILEGRMIVEIGIAAVRPAEFIIIRFSHKLAES